MIAELRYPRLVAAPCPNGCGFEPYVVRLARVFCAGCKHWYRAPEEKSDAD